MPSSTPFDEPPQYDTGDRVITRAPIGPVWHRRKPRGSKGIVIARTAERFIAVRFRDGQVEHLPPELLALDPGDGG
jgi:hypothetical protein